MTAKVYYDHPNGEYELVGEYDTDDPSEAYNKANKDYMHSMKKRSPMVGDLIVVGGTVYEIKPVGVEERKELDPENPRQLKKESEL